MLCIVGFDIIYNKLITLLFSRDSGFVQQCNKQNLVRHITPYRWTEIPLILILSSKYGNNTRFLYAYCIFYG